MLIFLLILYIPIILMLLLQWKVIMVNTKQAENIRQYSTKISWSDAVVERALEAKDKRYIG